jgi:hypothetical protein
MKRSFIRKLVGGFGWIVIALGLLIALIGIFIPEDLLVSIGASSMMLLMGSTLLFIGHRKSDEPPPQTTRRETPQHTFDTSKLPKRNNGWESSHRKGRSFEEYVITRFNNEEYRLIEWRSDKFIPGWGGPISSQWPDFVMEHIQSGERFAIECKYRSRVNGNRLMWAEPDQLENYRKYQAREKVPVYIAIGLAGEADAPESLFIVKLDRMKYPDVLMHYLEAFRFPTTMHGLEFG